MFSGGGGCGAVRAPDEGKKSGIIIKLEKKISTCFLKTHLQEKYCVEKRERKAGKEVKMGHRGGFVSSNGVSDSTQKHFLDNVIIKKGGGGQNPFFSFLF